MKIGVARPVDFDLIDWRSLAAVCSPVKYFPSLNVRCGVFI
jgi:hypothetical protein